MATQKRQYQYIELLTPTGLEYRKVSCAPPRLATEAEMPVIDLAHIYGTHEDRKKIAAEVKAAAQGSGFFYIENHGIPECVILDALYQARRFFGQYPDEKMKVSSHLSTNFSGYTESGGTRINRSESRDSKETFGWKYDVKSDPTHWENDTSPKATAGNDWLWEQTSHLEGFKDVTVLYWQYCLTLSRSLVRIFALALDLPEDYFDAVTTRPGADGMYIHYPVQKTKPNPLEIGIGSHTDIQCFTLLWQDMSGGLQVLSAQDEWLNAPPILGTYVVNIGDFLQRLSNNVFKSTVHRVLSVQNASRFSMPFFFGFNPDAVCGVVPTCVDEENPPLYKPISCGKWLADRQALAREVRAIDREPSCVPA